MSPWRCASSGSPRRRHQEKFVSLGGNPFGDLAEITAAELEIEEAESTDDDQPVPGGPQVPARLEVDLADGIRLAFQAVPVTDTVKVTYH